MRQWRNGILLAIIISILTSIPQLYVCLKRGSEWNGSYAFLDTDEFGYSGYVNALIQGRPRRNDPYTGNDSATFETLYSIQFVPAFLVAIPARAFHISTSTAFIALSLISAFVTAIVLFTLLMQITGNSSLSAAGVLATLFLGVALANTSGAISGAIGFSYLPIFRRYLPAIPFPVLFLMSMFMWRATNRGSVFSAVGAGLCMTFLIYSYFFLWTAALAWLLVLFVLLLLLGERKHLWTFLIVVLITGIALVPYGWLLMHRNPGIDQSQMLEIGRAPDLFRTPEVYSLLLLVWLLRQSKVHKFSLRTPQIIFALSFALAPLVVFNQQVVTGYSLQPFHYQAFVASYWEIFATIILFGVAWPSMPRRIPAYLSVGSVAIFLLLAVKTIDYRLQSQIAVDRVVPAAKKLESGVVFAPNLLVTNSLPSLSANPVLWGIHMYTFGNVTLTEQRRRFHQHLYYAGIDASSFEHALRENYVVRAEIFGIPRAKASPLGNYKAITEQEIISAKEEYEHFIVSFSRDFATSPLLSYALVSPEDNLSNLNRWYSLDNVGESDGFTVFRLRLRD